jgi:hypothetical protein
MADEPIEHEVNWTEGADITGCTPMQTKFVQGLCQGMTKTAAARFAGYQMEGAGLRGHAAKLAKSNRVRALLAWARTAGAGPSDNPGDVRELKRLLWRHARGSDAQRSIAAVQALHKIEADEREQMVSAFHTMSMEEFVSLLIAMAGPYGALFAWGIFAKKTGAPVSMPHAAKVAAIVKEYFPAYQKSLDDLDEGHRHWIPTIEQWANKPLAWREIADLIEDKLNNVTRPIGKPGNGSDVMEAREE